MEEGRSSFIHVLALSHTSLTKVTATTRTFVAFGGGAMWGL